MARGSGKPLIRLNISIDNMDKELDAALRRLAIKGRDLREPLTLFGEHMKMIAKDSIEGQRDPETGKKWQGLNSLTLGNRPKGGAGGKALFDTGRLLRSFVSAKPKVTKESVAIDSNVKYARIHQFGGVIRPVEARMLAIPLNRTAARAGRARRWWAQQEARARGGLGKPFIYRSDSGRLFIAYRKTAGSDVDRKKKTRRQRSGQLVNMFMLTDRVDIPARPYLGFGKKDRLKFIDFIRTHLQSLIRAKERKSG